MEKGLQIIKASGVTRVNAIEDMRPKHELPEQHPWRSAAYELFTQHWWVIAAYMAVGALIGVMLAK